MNIFVYHLLTLCTIFDETMSLGLLASGVFYRFMVISLFSWMTLPHSMILVIHCGSLRIKPSRHGYSSWQFLRLVSLQLIIPTKAIWDEWSSMYSYESNISWIVEVSEQLFKAKQSGRRLRDYYASIHGLFTELELYRPYRTNLMTQRHYREELD